MTCRMIIFLIQITLFIHDVSGIQMKQEDSPQDKSVAASKIIEGRSEMHKPSYHYEYGVISDETGDIKNVKEARDGDYVKGEYHLTDPDGFVRSVHYTVDKDKGYEAKVTRHKITQTIPPRNKMTHQPRWMRPPIIIENYDKMKQPYMIRDDPKTYINNQRQNMTIIEDQRHKNSIKQPLNEINQQNHLIQPFKFLEDQNKLIENNHQNNRKIQPFKYIEDHNQNNQLKLFQGNSLNEVPAMQLNEEQQPNNYFKLFESNPINNHLIQPLNLIEDPHQNIPIMQTYKLIENHPLMQPFKFRTQEPYEVVEHHHPKKRMRKFRKRVKKQHLPMKKTPKGKYIHHIPDRNKRHKGKYILPSFENADEVGFIESLTSMLMGEEKPVVIHRIKGGGMPKSYYNLKGVHPRKFVKRHKKYMKDQFAFHN